MKELFAQYQESLAEMTNFLELREPLMLVVGQEYTSKELLRDRLMSIAQTNHQVVHLTGSPEFSPSQLTGLLAQQFGIPTNNVENRYRDQLNQILDQLHQQKSCLLIVDDANTLPLSTLSALSHLAIKEEQQYETTKLHIVLFGDVELLEKIHSLQAGEIRTIRLNPPILEEELEEEMEKVTAEPRELTPKTSWISRHWIKTISVTALALLGLTLWHSGQNDEVENHNSAVLALASNTDVDPSAMMDNNSQTESEAQPESQQQQQQQSQPQPQPQSQPQSQSPQQQELQPPPPSAAPAEPMTVMSDQPVSEGVDTELSPEPTTTDIPAAAAVTSPSVAPTTIHKHSKKSVSSRPSKSQHQTFYALQLMGSENRSAVQAFVKKHRLTTSTRIVKTWRNGKPWYTLVYGHYSTYKQAELAKKTLPATLQQLHPWIHKVRI